MTSKRVKEILSWYSSECPGTLTNLARILTLALVAYKWTAKVANRDELWKAMESTWLSSIVPSLRKVTNEPVATFRDPDLTGGIASSRGRRSPLEQPGDHWKQGSSQDA